MVNFIAERRGVGDETVDWNHAVNPAPIVELFRDWRFDWLDVPGVIAAADEILEYPMVDRDPIPRWTFGRTTLLGDAAHAMYPNGSNGASQAILDARTLALHLATAADAPTALAAYEEARRPATTALVLSNRQQGPEKVMLLARERAPEGFADIEDVIPSDELAEIAAGYKRAAGFLPEILNAPLTHPAGPMTAESLDDVDAARLAAVISPLRRTLLSATRASAHLPDIPDAQIEIVRALPRGVTRTPGELAELLGLGRSTVSNLLTLMEERGLVQRRAVPGDRRRVDVTATAKALGLFERFDAASAALVAGGAQRLDAGERAVLTAALPVLERLRDALDEERRATASRTSTHSPRKEAE
ncbi:MarR family transcriptional regulator [Microbacterium sp. NPDC019599]|uniref:MarR family transcriptional regulator n=1 Tax=Microbacterium sp. NPDC019599 TaxID=3154690 RepID=UPI0034086F6D